MARVLPLVLLITCIVTASLCAVAVGAKVASGEQAAHTHLITGELSQTRRTVVPGRAQPLIVAHNAGDDLPSASRAVAARTGAVEIDVRSVEGELLASHDAPSPLLEDVAFHPPTLRQAWKIASRRPAVLLHLKQTSGSYLRAVRAFARAQPPRRFLVQSADVASLRWIGSALPGTERLLLLFDAGDVANLQAQLPSNGSIDGVSMRDSLATSPVLAWLRAHGLRTFVWSVDDPARVAQLARAGVDGIITDRLDVMRAYSAAA